MSTLISTPECINEENFGNACGTTTIEVHLHINQYYTCIFLYNMVSDVNLKSLSNLCHSLKFDIKKKYIF